MRATTVALLISAMVVSVLFLSLEGLMRVTEAHMLKAMRPVASAPQCPCSNR